MKDSFIQYPGSKKLLGKRIVSFFPRFHTSYIDLFGGSGAILFAREKPFKMEVFNDLNEDLTHLFKILRNHPEELIEKLRFTLYSEEELKIVTEETDDPIERARRYYVRLWLAHHPFRENPSFRRQQKIREGGEGVKADRWAKIDHLYAISDRLRRVQIENKNALEMIDYYDCKQALFYADPPYVNTNDHYGDLEHTEADHVALAERLNGIAGMAVLSGSRSDLYGRLYDDRGWARFEFEAHTERKTGETRKRIDCIWINPAVQKHLRNEATPQLSLFD